MYAVIRHYTGRGASQLFEEIECMQEEVEGVIRSVPGLVSYTLLRTGDGGISVTVCQDKAGTDESVTARRRVDKSKQHCLGQPTRNL